jgi:hypothetical protein
MSAEHERARRRGEAFKSRLVDSLEWIDVETASAELGCTVADIQAHLDADRLIAVEYSNRKLIPRDLIRQGEIIPGLGDVLGAMLLESPWIRLSWLVTPNPRLRNRTPLDAMDTDLDEVIWAARGVGVQGGA